MASIVSSLDFLGRKFTQLNTRIERDHELAWCCMAPEQRPCFSDQLLDDLNNWCSWLLRNAKRSGIKYHVIASDVAGVFNLGGDLDLFSTLSQKGDRAGLRNYGTACIDALYANIRGFEQDITTISLVQGEALGGGFETALSSKIIIAEKGSRMGFPEVLFNLFPGMGAYSLLSRRLSAARAEKIILSGKIYTAEELHEMGVVDILAEPGEGEQAVYDYIKRENRARNGFRAFRQVREMLQPMPYEELADVVEVWVEAAMKLDRKDYRMMQRLVDRQQKQGPSSADSEPAEAVRVA